MYTLASSGMAAPLFDSQLGTKVPWQRWKHCEVRYLLEKVLSDPKNLIQVAARSYVHQLGFEKYVLAESLDGSAVRLHFWPHDSKLADEDIHSHCASFSSTVILGSLTSQLYELKSGNTHMAYRYRFNRLSGHSEVTGGLPTAVSEVLQSTFDAGSSYMLDSQALHRVTGVAPGTATVSMWAQRFADAVVVKALKSRPEDCARQAGMTPFVVQKRLAQILDMIK